VKHSGYNPFIIIRLSQREFDLMSSIEITPLLPHEITAAAGLFARNFDHLREVLPDLSPNLADPARVEPHVARLFDQCPGLAARQGEELIGYLGWYIVPDLRGAGRLGAYVPEWGHSAVVDQLPEIYQALYGAAAIRWAELGCQVLAVTQLANNRREQEFWFWNGFGLAVVDAIRPMQPLEGLVASPLTIRKAASADAAVLHDLDVEHCRHYTQPPVFMAPRTVTSTEEFNAFISLPDNAVWMAWDEATPAGFMRFDGYETDGAAILEGEGGAFISGAYVRPGFRGRRAAQAMLDAALRDYAGRGFRRCVLDFEAFNPEARNFWLKYFQPAALSVMRMPEAPQAAKA
jgi:ribosomal protein S18 acetylase RimI-like enzyme